MQLTGSGTQPHVRSSPSEPGPLVRTIDDPAPQYRLRPRPGDAEEEALAAADRIGRAVACERASAALGGFRLEAFGQHLDDARMAVFDVAPELIEALDRDHAVDRALAQVDAKAPRLRLADGTKRAHIDDEPEIVRGPPDTDGESPARLRSFASADALTRGRTVVHNDFGLVERTMVQPLCHDLSRITGTDVQVNLYVSEREAKGFGRHWDDHNVLIVQLAGRKHWEVYAPAELSAQDEYVTRAEAGPSVIRTVLEPGMGLFIPRGWPHKVAGFPGTVSAHLTFSARLPTYIDVLSDAMLSTGPDLPGTWVPDDATEWALGDGGLREQFVPTELVEHTQARLRARIETVPACGTIRAGEALAGDFFGRTMSMPLPSGLVFAQFEAIREDELAFSSAERTFAVKRAVVRALEPAFAGEQFTLRDLVDTGHVRTEPEAAALIRPLALRDLIELHP